MNETCAKTPLLSIVIVNYNYGPYIGAAIRSVLSQKTDDVELLVVDGGSTDGSVETIRSFASDLYWWCSERDSGQSEAFNKGFSRARGRFLTWLNADDVLCSGAIESVISALRRHPEVEWFTGNFLRFLPDGKVVEIGWGPHWYPRFMQRKNSPLVIFGPSTVFSKVIWELAGRIDESLHLMMDTDLWMRFVVRGVRQRRINHFIWAFRMHERSKTAEFGDHVLDVRRKNVFKKESEIARAKSGYCCSRFMRFACLFLRIFDGSLLTKIWYRLTYTRFDEGSVL